MYKLLGFMYKIVMGCDESNGNEVDGHHDIETHRNPMQL